MTNNTQVPVTPEQRTLRGSASALPDIVTKYFSLSPCRSGHRGRNARRLAAFPVKEVPRSGSLWSQTGVPDTAPRASFLLHPHRDEHSTGTPLPSTMMVRIHA